MLVNNFINNVVTSACFASLMVGVRAGDGYTYEQAADLAKDDHALIIFAPALFCGGVLLYILGNTLVIRANNAKKVTGLEMLNTNISMPTVKTPNLALSPLYAHESSLSTKSLTLREYLSEETPLTEQAVKLKQSVQDFSQHIDPSKLTFSQNERLMAMYKTCKEIEEANGNPDEIERTLNDLEQRIEKLKEDYKKNECRMRPPSPTCGEKADELH